MDNIKLEKDVYTTQINRAIGDQFDTILSGAGFENLDLSDRRSSSSAALLALVTVLQYVEEIPDGLAAQATGKRMDWKYALHLPVHFPGVKPEVLCEFRTELFRSQRGRDAFQVVLDRLVAAGLLGCRRAKHVTTMQVLHSICSLSRLEKLFGAMSLAVEALAANHTDWLRQWGLPHWFQRYNTGSSLQPLPVITKQQNAIAQIIGVDLAFLLKAVDTSEQPEISAMPEIQALRKVWNEQFITSQETLQWVSPVCMGCR